MQSTDKDRIVNIDFTTSRAFYQLRKLGLKPQRNVSFKARLVKVKLDKGGIEVLLTSLTNRRQYPHRVFKWLYGKRWGVETAIFILKSFLQLPLISAYTLPGVPQDLWASFAFYNQQSVLVASCEDEVVRQTKHRRYVYKINRNVTAAIIQHFLYHIYLDGTARWRSRTLVLLKLMPRYTELYRPDRNRDRKIMRANSRHIHEKNYRKSM